MGLAAACVLGLAGGRLLALDLYADAGGGVDAPGHGLDASSPARTIAFALSLAASEGAESVVLHLASGSYRSDELAGGSEAYPLAVPASVRTLEIRSSDATSPARLELSPYDGASIDGDRAGALERLALRGIEISGGRTAVSLVSGATGLLEVEISGVSFSGQLADSLEFYGAPGAEVTVLVEQSRFSNVGGGVSYEGAGGSSARLAVRDATFGAVEGLGPEGLLGSGVALHADAEAEVEATVERSRFFGVASPVLLTQGEGEPPAQVALRLESSLVVSGAREAACEESGDMPLEAALYLSLPSARSRIEVLNNTFWGLGRFAVYEDHADQGLTALGSLLLANNIFWGPDAAAEPAASFSAYADFPGPATARANIVPAAWLPAEPGTNIAEDPRFVSPESCDFRLRPDSPAVDRGDPEAELLLGPLDLAGYCRQATLTGDGTRFPVDLGAYEREGYCASDPPAVFVRGDCNRSNVADLSDAVALFGFLFLGREPAPEAASCLDACDADDSGVLEITDGIYLLAFLFQGGAPVPPPYPEAGFDPTRDDPLGDCTRSP